jgi:hypothetical protein
MIKVQIISYIASITMSPLNSGLFGSHQVRALTLGNSHFKHCTNSTVYLQLSGSIVVVAKNSGLNNVASKNLRVRFINSFSLQAKHVSNTEDPLQTILRKCLSFCCRFQVCLANFASQSWCACVHMLQTRSLHLEAANFEVEPNKIADRPSRNPNAVQVLGTVQLAKR